MAALGAQSIASSYEQLLHVDRDGGGNSTTHVAIKDGDNGTTFGFTIATDALMMSSTNRLEFGDTGTYIHQSADGVLDLVSDTEIEINATTIDINGAVAMDGAMTGGTNITISGELDAATLDISGNADIAGTTNLDAVDIDGNVQLDGTFTIGTDGSGQDVTFYSATSGDSFAWDASEEKLTITGTNGQTALDIADGNLVVADNIDLEGDIDVNGTANLDAVDIDGAFTQDGGVVVFNEAGADYDFRVESDGNANMLFVDAGNNKVGIGENVPLGTMHVKTSDSGVSSPDITDLVVETSGSGGISILSGTGDQGEIAFGDSGDANIGRIAYNHGGNYLATVVNGSEVMRITSAGLIGVASAAASPSHLLDITANDGVSDNNAVARFVNSEATDGRSKGVYIRAGSTGDDWPLFIDDHDASNNLLSLRGNGAFTTPKTPAFLARPASDQNNFAENSNVTVVLGTEVFDQGSNFASNTFTAPATGRYQLSGLLYLQNIELAAEYYEFKIVTSNRTYFNIFNPGGLDTDDLSYWCLPISVLADMDASDTATLQIRSGGTASDETADIGTGSYFSGYLAC